MLVTNKNHVSVDQKIYIVVDERPFAPISLSSGHVTDIQDDHYLYNDDKLNIQNVWGLYDSEIGDSIMIFSTENEAKNYCKEN